MNVTTRDSNCSSLSGTLAAGAIMVCAALTLFLTHGFSNGWNLASEHWDAAYYFQIAATGYHGSADRALAFLPGYSIFLIPASRLLVTTPFLASFLTSSILSVLAGATLFRLLRKRLGTAVSLAGIALLAFSPFSIYLYNGYSEPAFFLCVALAILWLADGRILLAAAATGYAFLCRPYAIALLPLFLPVAWSLLRDRDFWKLGWIVTLGALPGLFYAGYMYHMFGDPFIAFKTLTHWQQYESISSAWPLPIRTMFAFHFAFRNSAPGSWSLSLTAYFLAAVAVLAAAARLPWRLVLYSLLLLVCVYLTDALGPVNLGRHTVLAFAFCPGIAALVYSDRGGNGWLKASRHAAFAVAFVFFAATFIVMGMRFSQGLWVS